MHCYLMIQQSQKSTLFPYTTLFRSLGVQYMWAAGYDPGAMATMFEKLEAKNKKKPGTLAKMFMDHPAPAARRASALALAARDRKSTRLNSSHTVISYAVFCLKKKNK